MMKHHAPILMAVALLVAACAKQGYPSGGPRDTEPPKSVGCKPANETRNFGERQFFIGFDEYVVLRDADNNVLISPPMKHKPEFTTKGKGILVRLKDTLQENTTYLFQFKDAIADFTEGNRLPSFEYVFATGSTMDTLMLAGRVEDARSGRPRKETVTVMAYAETLCTSDTMATAVAPSFVTRCDQQGRFEFHYIPAGRYRLVAIEDKDRNLRVGTAEAVAWDKAFHPSQDSIDTAAMPVLRMSVPQTQRQRITGSGFTARGRISISTLLPMERPVVSGVEHQWRLNSSRDTLTLWCLDPKCDSALVVVSDTGLQDTLKLRYRQSQRKGSKRRGGQPSDKLSMIRPLCGGSNAYYDDLHLGFAAPIAAVAEGAVAEILCLKDSSRTVAPISLDSSAITATIEASLRSGEQYEIHLRDSLFTDMYGQVSDSLTFGLTPKDYGILSLDIDNRSGGPLVIEVLDKRDTVVTARPLAASGRVSIAHLPGGEYRLRAVLDSNGDHRWTPGNYLQGVLPERCVYFEKTMQLREKWEMEERWTVADPDAKPTP